MAEESKNGDEKRLINGRKLAETCVKGNLLFGICPAIRPRKTRIVVIHPEGSFCNTSTLPNCGWGEKGKGIVPISIIDYILRN